MSNPSELDLHKRITSLQESIVPLEREIRTLEGKITNRSPAAVAVLKKEKARLLERVKLLEKALYAIVALDAFKPRSNEDSAGQYELVRAAAVEHCKNANLDAELWKNIES